MNIKLTFKKMDQILKVVTITPAESPFRMGRGKDNEFMIEEPHISRHHAQIEFKEGKWFLLKMTKTGKLIYDGKNIEKQELTLPTSFEIPPYAFTVEVAQEEKIEVSISKKTELKSEPRTEPSTEIDEKEIFTGLIEDGKVRLARMRMLAVVDFLWGQRRISDEDAKKKYEIIGFTPDEASIIRQSSVAGQFEFK